MKNKIIFLLTIFFVSCDINEPSYTYRISNESSYDVVIDLYDRWGNFPQPLTIKKGEVYERWTVDSGGTYGFSFNPPAKIFFTEDIYLIYNDMYS